MASHSFRSLLTGFVVVTIVSLSTPAVGGSTVFGCTGADHSFDRVFPQEPADSDGGRFSTTVRTSTASDWNDNPPGHIGVHLWVSTDNYGGFVAQPFVEAFVEDGKYSTGAHRRFFGTAHQVDGGPYQEAFWSVTPQLNTSATLSAWALAAGTNKYQVTYSTSYSSGQIQWSGHAVGTDVFEGGIESSSSCNRQDRSYATTIQWRKRSTGVWNNIQNRSLHPGSSTSIGSCGTLNYRVWLNSQLATGICG